MSLEGSGHEAAALLTPVHTTHNNKHDTFHWNTGLKTPHPYGQKCLIIKSFAEY